MELADNAYLHGFSRMTLLRCYVPRYHEPGRLMLWRDFLLAVERGEFDYMLMDASEQPYS